MVKEEPKKQESYFKNKFLRFLFNSKENVHEGIFIVNTVIYAFVLLILNFIIVLPPISVDSLFYGSNIYDIGLGFILLGLYLFFVLVSLIEIELFEYFIKE